jgi:Putative transmembrane protein (PGPGW)
VADLIARLSQNRTLLLALGVSSVVMFVGSLLALPVIIARAPHDYFVRANTGEHHVFVRVVKNLIGVILVMMGLAMLLLPGQGVLTLLVGLALLDLPGKHQRVVQLARRPAVWRALSYIRAKTGRPPFKEPI